MDMTHYCLSATLCIRPFPFITYIEALIVPLFAQCSVSPGTLGIGKHS